MNVLTVIFIAVLNTFWQTVLLAALTWLAMQRASRVNAATRFAIWWAVLLVVLMLPFTPGIISVARNSMEPRVIESARVRYAPLQSQPPAIAVAPLVTVGKPEGATWPLWVAVIWGMAAVIRLTHLAHSYLHLRGLKRGATISDRSLPHTERQASLLLSPEIESPVAVGFIRPAVILPNSLSAKLTPEQVDHVILHEAAHLARYDDWTNLLSRVLAALLILHPVALWILRQLDIEREVACDDWTVARTQSARRYAETLVTLHELRAARWRSDQLLAPGVFGRGSCLPDRLEKLMRAGRDFTSRVSMARVSAGLVLLAGLIFVASFSPRWIAVAQTPRAAFEVASIRPADSAQTMAITRSGNRVSFSNYSLEMLIEWAYGIRSDRLLGRPRGVDSVRFDINAVSPPEPLPRGQLYLMMQTLLAERFGLVAHMETRELTHYEMVVDKGGARVHPEPLTESPGQNPFSMTARGHLAGTKVTAAMLATVLTDQTGRFVEDRTGLNGVFDFMLNWTPDDVEPSSGNAPSLLTAVREQLGLRLNVIKGPVEVVVIDHVETTPTAN